MSLPSIMDISRDYNDWVTISDIARYEIGTSNPLDLVAELHPDSHEERSAEDRYDLVISQGKRELKSAIISGQYTANSPLYYASLFLMCQQHPITKLSALFMRSYIQYRLKHNIDPMDESYPTINVNANSSYTKVYYDDANSAISISTKRILREAILDEATDFLSVEVVCKARLTSSGHLVLRSKVSMSVLDGGIGFFSRMFRPLLSPFRLSLWSRIRRFFSLNTFFKYDDFLTIGGVKQEIFNVDISEYLNHCINGYEVYLFITKMCHATITNSEYITKQGPELIQVKFGNYGINRAALMREISLELEPMRANIRSLCENSGGDCQDMIRDIDLLLFLKSEYIRFLFFSDINLPVFLSKFTNFRDVAKSVKGTLSKISDTGKDRKKQKLQLALLICDAFILYLYLSVRYAGDEKQQIAGMAYKILKLLYNTLKYNKNSKFQNLSRGEKGFWGYKDSKTWTEIMNLCQRYINVFANAAPPSLSYHSGKYHAWH